MSVRATAMQERMEFEPTNTWEDVMVCVYRKMGTTPDTLESGLMYTIRCRTWERARQWVDELQDEWTTCQIHWVDGLK